MVAYSSVPTSFFRHHSAKLKLTHLPPNSESVSIPVNPRTNRPVGYAFVDLATAHEATAAIEELSGKEILQRKVSVQLARKPEPAEAKEGAASGGEGASGNEGRKRAGGRGRARGRGRGRGGRLGRGGRSVSLRPASGLLSCHLTASIDPISEWPDR